MNSDPTVYSQGFNLVNFFGSAAAGGHHVMTNRHPESEYKLKASGSLCVGGDHA